MAGKKAGERDFCFQRLNGNIILKCDWFISAATCPLSDTDSWGTCPETANHPGKKTLDSVILHQACFHPLPCDRLRDASHQQFLCHTSHVRENNLKTYSRIWPRIARCYSWEE